MRELLRTNDPVRISWLTALLRDAGIDCFVFDQHTSAAEGGISALPRRIMVGPDDWSQARRVLKDCGEDGDLPA